MCAIFGCLATGLTPPVVSRLNQIIDWIFVASWERGRDGWGYYVNQETTLGSRHSFERRSVERNSVQGHNNFFDDSYPVQRGAIIGNLRAEPTTEYVSKKRDFDQQPYGIENWNIVHNGTIANDDATRTFLHPTNIDSAAIVETLEALTAMIKEPSEADLSNVFSEAIEMLKGSYAILATHDQHPGIMFVACNYRPIWYAKADGIVLFASSRDYFPAQLSPQMIPPYSAWSVTTEKAVMLSSKLAQQRERALVVCSGGMDSVVAAKALQTGGMDVHLLHFQYGSRAETPEMAAIMAVANAMDVPLHVLPMGIYDESDSPLLQKDSKIAGGEAGAEFAHEWVPARNLVMLALATAYAEAKGFDVIGLGNNLEEAGAYPDNEPEFVNRFNDMLPFAVGDGKRLRVVMPVGNLMKHEIVALGEQLGAPMGLTWSCYRSGPLHCGTCGPCFMRKTAYEINKLQDPLQYAKKDI